MGKRVLYKNKIREKSQASDIRYNISSVKIPLGVGVKAELILMLLRYLLTIWCLVVLWSKLQYRTMGVMEER